MIINAPSDIAFSVFDFPIYWYGIILAISIYLGFFLADYLSKYRNIKSGFILENALLLIITGLLGARLYYCLLNFSYYVSRPIEVLDLRQGGLSIHGMLIAGAITLIFITKKYKIELFSLLDVSAVAVALSQAIGRWGNYFNSEAFGLPTYSDWGLFVPLNRRPLDYVDNSLFHPTFLYESILNLLLFFILLFVLKKINKSGIVFALYLIFYSIIRIFVEQIRIDSAFDLFGLPIAQVVSFVLLIVGSIILFVRKN